MNFTKKIDSILEKRLNYGNGLKRSSVVMKLLVMWNRFRIGPINCERASALNWRWKSVNFFFLSSFNRYFGLFD